MRDVRVLIVLAVLTGAATAAQQHAEPVTGTAIISGRVVDGVTGAPLARARVTLSRQPYVSGLPSAVSDDRGAFTIGDLPAGEYTIWSAKGGYLSGGSGKRRPAGVSVPLTLPEGARVSDAVVIAWREASVAGSVVDERGLPIAGAHVQVVKRQPWGDRFRYTGAGTSATTDDRGEYRIAQLSPGDYIVVVPSTSDSRVVANVPPQRDVTAGRSRASFEPAFGTNSYLMAPDGRTVLLLRGPVPPAPDLEGRPRAFTTSVAGGLSLRGAQVIKLAAGEAREHVDVQLRASRAARVSGHITGPDGPVAGVVVRLIPEDWDGPAYLSQFSANATADGAFSFLLVPSGRYTLVAARRLPPLSDVTIGPSGGIGLPMDCVIMADTESLWARTSIAVGEADTADLGLVLRPGIRISGTLAFDADAAPGAAAIERMRTAFQRIGGADGGDDSYGAFTQPAGPGRFTIRVAPGRHVIDAGRILAPNWHFKTAILNGREIGAGPLDIGTDDVTDLVLMFTNRTAELRGTVAGERGEPIVNATVAVFPTDRSNWNDEMPAHMEMRWRVATRTAVRREYSFTALPAGEYFVVAVDDSEMEHWPDPGLLEVLSEKAARITLTDGERRVMDLRVRQNR
jgi:Carboxypeptidase regulatory-like domain